MAATGPAYMGVIPRVELANRPSSNSFLGSRCEVSIELLEIGSCVRNQKGSGGKDRMKDVLAQQRMFVLA